MRKLFHRIKECFLNRKELDTLRKQLGQAREDNNFLRHKNEILKKENYEYYNMLNKAELEEVEVFLDRDNVDIQIRAIYKGGYEEGNSLYRHPCGYEIIIESGNIIFNGNHHSLIIKKNALRIFNEEED